ncbi:hypothetical protein HHI36_010683 [Cryptolaemus montrouzieri]|uniref:Uncharacterized protein n=1 Tax=Cryptolaemus montrouzieri TaxID=559131 RepID=A0ABD2MJI0_9CUCU
MTTLMSYNINNMPYRSYVDMFGSGFPNGNSYCNYYQRPLHQLDKTPSTPQSNDGECLKYFSSPANVIFCGKQVNQLPKWE